MIGLHIFLMIVHSVTEERSVFLFVFGSMKSNLHVHFDKSVNQIEDTKKHPNPDKDLGVCKKSYINLL